MRREVGHAGAYWFCLRQMQTQKLYVNEKQKNYHGKTGIEKVLSGVSGPYAAS
jgi:hypothetical protein